MLAGKAHPRDEEAKHSLQHLFGLKSSPVVGQRVVYLDDYDLATAAVLVRGCDVWLNLPRPPLEASGTSGMKSAFNGGLQLSVLDGWWAEAYDGAQRLGAPRRRRWTTSTPRTSATREVLHRLLDEEIVPAFYDRDERGLPQAWLARIRASLRTLGPRFCATRMLAEYVQGPYRDGLTGAEAQRLIPGLDPRAAHSGRAPRPGPTADQTAAAAAGRRTSPSAGSAGPRASAP